MTALLKDFEIFFREKLLETKKKLKKETKQAKNTTKGQS